MLCKLLNDSCYLKPLGTISLNRLDAMVQLRPLFTHLDALTDQDKSTLTNKLRGGMENPPLETEAKAVTMRAKSTEEDDTDSVGSTSRTAKILKAMREEPWQRLSWIDSEVRVFPWKHVMGIANGATG